MNEPWIANSPYGLKWNKGELPGADLMPFGCVLAICTVWNYDENHSLHGKARRLSTVRPWKSVKGNYYWIDDEFCWPCPLVNEKVMMWAYLCKPDGPPVPGHKPHQV